MILEEPIDAALANVEILKRYAVVLLVVGLAVGAADYCLGKRQDDRADIGNFGQGVATIGAGNLEHRTSIKTGDEIQDLAEEFNRMTDALQNSYATLEQKVDADGPRRYGALRSHHGGKPILGSERTSLDAVIAKTTEIFQF